MEKKFWKLVKSSDNIAITSHIAPDPDAICSLLLLGLTLKKNFKSKNINLLMEEAPIGDMSFLSGYNSIKFGNLFSQIHKIKPDLIIIVDTNKFGRCSRNEPREINDYVLAKKIPVAIIDHHEPDDKLDKAIFINHQTPAATQEIFSLCFVCNNLVKPQGYENITMLGIVSDTGRFKYANKMHRETFRIVSDLIDAGASIEKLENKLAHYTKDQIEVLSHVMTNCVSTGTYTYSLVRDDFAENWQKDRKSISSFIIGCKIFVDQYLRNISSNDWGFMVYQDFKGGKNHYSVSLRSVDGSRDVSKIAFALGGGGHKQSAGIKIVAKSVDEVVKKIEKVI